MKIRDVKVGMRVEFKVRRSDGHIYIEAGTVKKIEWARRLTQSLVELVTDGGCSYRPVAGKLLPVETKEAASCE